MRKRYAIVLGWLTAIGSAGAAQVADYRFGNNLRSSIAGAPDLAVIGTGAGFATEDVLGQPQVVFRHTIESGLALAPITDLLANPDVYTIILRVRHEASLDSLYVKYIDYANGTLDAGLYDAGGHLDFYTLGAGAGPVIGTDFVDIAITRDAGGTLTGYVGGEQQFALDDSVARVGVVDASSTLRFVYDDEETLNVESAPGAVARLRIWNTALAASEIAALSTERIFADGFDLVP